MTAGASDAPAVRSRFSARPFSAFEWTIALRCLRVRRRCDSVSEIVRFAFLVVVLGVAALIVLMSVMNGFRRELLERTSDINGHMFLHEADAPMTDYRAVARRVGEIPGISLAAPLVEGQALALSPTNSFGVLVRGIDEADLRRLPGVVGKTKAGALDSFDNGGGAVIGSKLAERLNLHIGNKITIVSPRGAQTPDGLAPRVEAYTVTAIIESGMSNYDAVLVFLPLAEAQVLFSLDGRASAIEVYVDDPEDMDAVHARVETALRRPITMTDWRKLNKGTIEYLNARSNAAFLILSLIVFAALNATTSLILLAPDKAPGVAVLRAMGATRGAILRVFAIAAATIGIFGALAGAGLGLLIAYNVELIRKASSWLAGVNLSPSEYYYLSQLPSRVEARDVIAVVLLTLFLSLAATIYPCWRAAPLDPIGASRSE